MKGMNEFLLHAIGLGVPYAQLHHLIRYWGGMEVVNEMSLSELAATPGVHPKLAQKLLDKALKPNVERGLAQAQKEGWSWTCWSREDFPNRLKECEDAPLMLFYKGKTNWNTQATLAIVGTRKAQPAACDWVDLQIKQFKAACTPLVVVQGLRDVWPRVTGDGRLLPLVVRPPD
jgi:DNA processing protein